MVCKNCHFDPESDSLVAEGSPCGVTDNHGTCMSYTCCTKTWTEHCKKRHKQYYRENLAMRVTFKQYLSRKFFRFYYRYILRVF